MDTLKTKVDKLARNLPVNSLIANEIVAAELRWE